MKDLLLRAGIVIGASNMKSSSRHLADYVKELRKKVYFPHSDRAFKSLICDVVVAVAVVISKTRGV